MGTLNFEIPASSKDHALVPRRVYSINTPNIPIKIAKIAMPNKINIPTILELLTTSNCFRGSTYSIMGLLIARLEIADSLKNLS